MTSNIRVGLLVILSLFGLAMTSNSFAADSQATKNRINKLTKDLKKLPNQGAPSSRVGSLVRKLVKLQPGKTSEYYLVGLRKVGTPGAAGKTFAKRLRNDLAKLIEQSDLSEQAKDRTLRRINKGERVYVPPVVEPTPPPYSAKQQMVPFQTFA